MVTRNRLKTLLYVSISALILTALILLVDYTELWSALTTGNVPLIAVTTLCLTTVLPMLLTLKWQQTLLVLGHQASLWSLLRLQLATFPISKLSPGNVGDLMKAYYLRDEVAYQPHMGGIAFERLVDLVVIFSFATIGGLVAGHTLASLMGGSALIGLVLLMAGTHRFASQSTDHRLLKKVQRFLVVFSLFAKHPERLGYVVLCSLLAWTLIFTYIYTLFLAFDATVSWLTVITLQPIAIAGGLLPFTLAGIGTREAAMLFLYSPLLSEPVILAVGIIYSVFSTVVLSLAGLPFLRGAFSNHSP